MPEVIDEKLPNEAATIKTAMSGWMEGLRSALPNPQLGQGGAEPSAPTEPVDPLAEPAPIAEATPSGPVVDPNAGPAGKPVVPKPTEANVTEPAPGEERWPRSAKEWKNFTTARKAKDSEYEKQITERDQRIKELEAKASGIPDVPPQTQKEIEALRKENEEYSKQLRLVAVTRHPKFKNYFDTKINGALAQIKSCVPLDQVDNVTRLVRQPDSEQKDEAINGLLENMTTLQRVRMQGVLTSLASIDNEYETEIARANQDYEQMVAAGKTEQEQRVAGFNKLLDDTVKGMQDAKNGRPEYQVREGQAEWNASVQKRIEAGRKLISGNLAPEVMFKAAFDAAAYPDVVAGYRAALGEVEKLKKQLAAMTAANPRVESPKRTEPTSAQPGSAPHMPKDARPMDYTRNWVKQFGDALRGEAA